MGAREHWRRGAGPHSSPDMGDDESIRATGDRVEPPSAALELLRLGQFDRLADVLYEAGESKGLDDAISARMIDAAQRICVACSQDQEEAAWHREALSRIRSRQYELTGSLEAMIDLIGEAPLHPSHDHEKRMRRSAGEEDGLQGHVPRALAFRTKCTPALSLGGEGSEVVSPLSPLAVHCLGPFQTHLDDQLVEEWPNRKGKGIFKFMVTQQPRPVNKEVLMDLFWPNAEPTAARNNLNVAIHGLRQAFANVRRSWSVVLFRNDCYVINPDLEIWIDYDQFCRHFAAGREFERRGELTLAMDEYRSAESLYGGEFLEEDRYEEWPDPLRQSLKADYLALLERVSGHAFEQQDYDACAALCDKTLSVDPCCEDSHRRLMRCRSRQGLIDFAVRQYQACREALARGLGLEPSQATVELFEQIRRRESV